MITFINKTNPEQSFTVNREAALNAGQCFSIFVREHKFLSMRAGDLYNLSTVNEICDGGDQYERYSAWANKFKLKIDEKT